ncbi:hypothetical protein [Kordia sp.]|uniref:hypothetical protein n=1 Tax=Kordia sp. TaxID=1965332 RepID=UPI0025C102B7|nr:hypothetical protein [Kordia sp.]MCH2197098.1 hypothetical protein [Kordia sp.]
MINTQLIKPIAQLLISPYGVEQYGFADHEMRIFNKMHDLPTIKTIQFFVKPEQLQVFVDILYTEDPELLVADQIEFHNLLFEIFADKINKNEISTYIASRSNNEASYELKFKLYGNE